MAVNKIYQDSVIAGGSIRDGQGKRIDTTYAYLDSNKKVPVSLLPKIAVTVPSVVTGLYITKVSDTTFRVEGGYCADIKNTTVLSLDNSIYQYTNGEWINTGEKLEIEDDILHRIN